MRLIAISLVLLAGYWTPASLAETRMHRVGILFPAGATPGSSNLIKALAERGYAEGINITYDIRTAGRRTELLPQLARELVARKPDAIVSATEPAARALADATRHIPIVLALIGDPVLLQLSRSLARPTSNVTGFTTGNETVAAKRLHLLHELVPTARKVALMWVPGNTQNRLVLERTRQAAAALKIELVSLPVTDAEDIPRAIAKAEKERAGALLVAADPLTLRNRRTIIDQSLFANLPAMHSYAVEVRDGALISYGGDVVEDFGRAAGYVDRILRGASVAELPFQEPTQIRLAINLLTAQAIGLIIPPSILVRADEVID